MDGTIIPGVLAHVFTTPILRAAYLRRKIIIRIYSARILNFLAIKLVKRMIWENSELLLAWTIHIYNILYPCKVSSFID